MYKIDFETNSYRALAYDCYKKSYNNFYKKFKK